MSKQNDKKKLIDAQIAIYKEIYEKDIGNVEDKVGFGIFKDKNNVRGCLFFPNNSYDIWQDSPVGQMFELESFFPNSSMYRIDSEENTYSNEPSVVSIVPRGKYADDFDYIGLVYSENNLPILLNKTTTMEFAKPIRSNILLEEFAYIQKNGPYDFDYSLPWNTVRTQDEPTDIVEYRNYINNSILKYRDRRYATIGEYLVFLHTKKYADYYISEPTFNEKVVFDSEAFAMLINNIEVKKWDDSFEKYITPILFDFSKVEIESRGIGNVDTILFGKENDKWNFLVAFTLPDEKYLRHNLIDIGKIDDIKKYFETKESTEDIVELLKTFVCKLLVKYGLVLNSENSPFDSDIEERTVTFSNREHIYEKQPASNSARKFRSRTIHIAKRYRYKSLPTTSNGEMSKEGKHQEERRISGFIRLQHFGEHNKFTKSIFIEGFVRQQWIRDGYKVTYVKK